MKKLFINPGHSDRDPGAVGFVRERDLNVRTAEFMRKALEDYAVQTQVYSDDSLTKVCQKANEWDADLFVSIHFNAGGGDGFECYVHNESRRPLGAAFEKQVLAVGQNSRGVKLQPGFIVLRDTYMPAVLLEGAFVDNQKDIADWDEDGELQKLGAAYAKAAAEFLQLEKKTSRYKLCLPLGEYESRAKAETAQKALQAQGIQTVIL